jgi:hypothetical protein
MPNVLFPVELSHAKHGRAFATIRQVIARITLVIAKATF